MYVGRIVGVGRTLNDENTAIYRVSSRSFPNRSATLDKDNRGVHIASRPGSEAENATSPYVAYSCLQILENHVVISNGTQTTPIADRIAKGEDPKQALSATLLEMGYEQDDLSTPRIAAVLPRIGSVAWLGIVSEDALLVECVNLDELGPGVIRYVSTYEHNSLSPDQLIDSRDVSANMLAQSAVDIAGTWSALELPVTAVAATANTRGEIQLAVADNIY